MEKWTEQFDKRFSLDGFGQEDDVHNKVKQFISDLLAERYHDHKILVNSILDIKNKELEARDKEWLSCLPEEEKVVAQTRCEFYKKIGRREFLRIFKKNARAKKLI